MEGNARQQKVMEVNWLEEMKGDCTDEPSVLHGPPFSIKSDVSENKKEVRRYNGF